jgi:glycosyltransferase involved in cell wall biosynthesis
VRIAIHVDGAAIRGNERQVMLTARELARRGHHVAASCVPGSATEAGLRRLGLATTGVRPRGDADAVSALAFAAWLRRGRFDAVLLTSWKRSLSAGWAARMARVPRVVLRVGGVHRVPRGAGGFKHRRALTRYVHAVIANSTEVAGHLAASVPALAGRIHRVPNGVELEGGAAAPAPLVPLPRGAVLALTVGGVEPRKGVGVLLEALAAGDPALHLAVAGDGPERPALQRRAAELGIAGRVHWLGHRRDVPALLAAADLFVLASRNEGMAVAMLEAMAAGLPVVCTAVAGAAEALGARGGRGPAGWIVPVDDAAALAAALREVGGGVRAGGGEVRARAAEAAWRVAHWFTVERMADGVEAVLRGEGR